jgi:hypothetical protein
MGEMKKVGCRFGSATRVRRRAADGGTRCGGTDRGRQRLRRDRGRRKLGWVGARPKGCGGLGRRWNFQKKSVWAAMAIGPN